VIWNEQYRDGDEDGNFGRIFDLSGKPTTALFQVNSYTTSRQFWPDVASCESGEFVVVWQGYDRRGSSSAIFARRFGSTGNPAGTEFVVNSQTSPRELKTNPVVAMTPQCDAVVSWRNLIQDLPERADVVVRRLANDFASEMEVRINTFEGNPITDFDLEAEMAADEHGRLLVAWPSREDGDLTGVIARPLCLDDQKYRACGDVTCVGGSSANPNAVTTADAAVVLRGAVGLDTCVTCLCDTDGSGAVDATDALLVLRRSVGLPADFRCPACEADMASL
jgi:hypothetical protein